MTAAARSPRASRAARFTQLDVARALKGALACGLKVERVTIDRDGRIEVVLAIAVGVPSSPPKNDWD